jgi:hypothetical protein
MLGILAYLGAVVALFVGAIFGLMVLLGESAEVGRNLASYSDTSRTAMPARTARASAEPDASAVSRTTGLAPKAERGPRAKGKKSRSAKADKRKKRSAQMTRERR